MALYVANLSKCRKTAANHVWTSRVSHSFRLSITCFFLYGVCIPFDNLSIKSLFRVKMYNMWGERRSSGCVWCLCRRRVSRFKCYFGACSFPVTVVRAWDSGLLRTPCIMSPFSFTWTNQSVTPVVTWNLIQATLIISKECKRVDQQQEYIIAVCVNGISVGSLHKSLSIVAAWGSLLPLLHHILLSYEWLCVPVWSVFRSCRRRTDWFEQESLIPSMLCSPSGIQLTIL